MNVFKLARDVFSTEAQPDRTRLWLASKGLISLNRHCDKCGSECLGPYFSEKKGSLGTFICKKVVGRNSHARLSFSGSEGTWFFNHNISLEKNILLIYAFAVNFTHEQTMKETSIEDEITSSETVCDFVSYCREVVLDAMVEMHETEGKIGGPGFTVEIDESKVGKRKYNRGRLVYGSWILSMIERKLKADGTFGIGRFRLVVCPENKQDAATLLPIITANVADNSYIMTDAWKGYSQLSSLGFLHSKVIHEQNFVSPADCNIHTQAIESNWRPLKAKILKNGIPKDQLGSRLYEYLWRRHVSNNNIDSFEELLKLIAHMYPPRV